MERDQCRLEGDDESRKSLRGAFDLAERAQCAFIARQHKQLLIGCDREELSFSWINARHRQEQVEPPACRNLERRNRVGNFDQRLTVLLAEALLNEAKFGMLTPFTYGGRGGYVEMDRYAALLGGAALIFAAAFIVDVSRPAVERLIRRHAPKLLLGAAAISLAALAFASARTFVHSLYVLIVDLQALPDSKFQPGLVRDGYGQIAFWGLPKKALLQSLPFATLLIVSIAALFSGRRATGLSLLLSLAAAPIAFYGLNYWHGGMGYNLRYFLPCLPFIAILTALALVEVEGRAPVSRRATVYAFAVGGGCALFPLSVADGLAAARLPLLLYPQLALAAATFIAAASYLYRPTDRTARVTLVTSLVAIGCAAVVGLSDEFQYERQRLARQGLDRAHLAALTSGDLAIASSVEVFVAAESKGSSVFQMRPGAETDAVEAAWAFAAAGRCVLANGEAAIAALGALDPRPVAVVDSFWSEPYAVLGDCAGRPLLRPAN